MKTKTVAEYFANGPNAITHKSITEHEIQCLRREARDHGDLRMAMICDLALDEGALDGAEPGTDAAILAEEGRTQEWAISEIVRVINAAAASADS